MPAEELKNDVAQLFHTVFYCIRMTNGAHMHAIAIEGEHIRSDAIEAERGMLCEWLGYSRRSVTLRTVDLGTYNLAYWLWLQDKLMGTIRLFEVLA